MARARVELRASGWGRWTARRRWTGFRHGTPTQCGKNDQILKSFRGRQEQLRVCCTPRLGAAPEMDSWLRRRQPRRKNTPPDDGELEVIETAGLIGLIVFSDLVFRFAEEHAS